MSTLEGAGLELADDLTELRRTRDWLRKQLSELHEEQAEDLIIVAEEMVSNALRHGSTPRAIRLRRQADSLRLEVDDGSTTTAHARTPDFHGGRGLTLVGTLAAAWGQNVRESGKTVWAEFTLTPKIYGVQS